MQEGMSRSKSLSHCNIMVHITHIHTCMRADIQTERTKALSNAPTNLLNNQQARDRVDALYANRVDSKTSSSQYTPHWTRFCKWLQEANITNPFSQAVNGQVLVFYLIGTFSGRSTEPSSGDIDDNCCFGSNSILLYSSGMEIVTNRGQYGYGASFSDTADASRNKIPVCAINTGAVIDGTSTSSHITLYP